MRALGRTWVFLLLIFPAALRTQAAGPYRQVVISDAELQAAAQRFPEMEEGEPQRLVAAALALTLGPFGAHRLYLGTDVKVPIIYGITFGGFGLLAVIDMVHILVTKDLDACRNDGRVFMWAKPRSEGATPP